MNADSDKERRKDGDEPSQTTPDTQPVGAHRMRPAPSAAECVNIDCWNDSLHSDPSRLTAFQSQSPYKIAAMLTARRTLATSRKPRKNSSFALLLVSVVLPLLVAYPICTGQLSYDDLVMGVSGLVQSCGMFFLGIAILIAAAAISFIIFRIGKGLVPDVVLRDPCIPILIRRLAHVARALGRSQESGRLYDQALIMQLRNPFSEDEQIPTLDAYSDLLRSLNRNREARRLELYARELRSRKRPGKGA